MNTFRSWRDDELGLEPISSPNTMSVNKAPHNADLIRSVVGLIAALNPRAPPEERKPDRSLRTQVKRLRLKLLEQGGNLDAIGRDWHNSQQEVLKLRIENSSLRRRIDELLARR
jgi:hypothetical protein